MKKKIMDVLLTDEVISASMIVAVVISICGLSAVSYELGKRDA